MRLLALLRSSWRVLARRDRVEQSLDDELRTYIDLLAADYERAGLTAEAARRRALVETGRPEAVKDATRDAWLGAALVTAVREVRFTLRALRNAPVFSLVSLAVLAIGIGGATAIFTVIKGSLLQPLPAVVRPSELVSLEPTKGDALLYDFSYRDYRALRDQARSVSGLAGYDGTSMTLEDRWGPRRATWISWVTGDFFSVLGATPAFGRLIQPIDEAEGNPVVVLAHDLWQNRYGSDSSIVGSTIRLAGNPFTVIGIAQPRFIGAMLMHPMELWLPVTGMPSYRADDLDVRVVGRLAPGRTVDDVQRESALLATRLAEVNPADKGHGIRVFSGAGMTHEERTALAKMPRLLAVAVGLLLLIACANVANLSLVRASARRRELATRLALGASRRSLIGRSLLDGGVLAAAGAVLGVGLAQALVRSDSIVRTVAGMPARAALDVTLDRRVVLLALGAAVFTALLVSLAPALDVLSVAPGSLLKDGAAGAVRRRSAGQRVLVAAQVGLSLVLLVSAAIVDHTVRRVLSIEPGFEPRGVVAATADTREPKLDSAQVVAYRRAWIDQASREPSVAAVAIASVVPGATWARPSWVFHGGLEPPPGLPLGDAPAGGRRAYLDVVSSGFFDVMHIPLVLGRGFSEGDADGAEPVVVVSQRLAATLWQDENPLGKMLSLAPRRGHRRPAMRVIGVAGDVRFASIFAEPPSVAYMPVAQQQDPAENLVFIVRSRNGDALPDAVVRGIGTRTDARVPMFTNVISEEIADQLRPQRVASAWIGVFGGIALLLAAIGLYGVVAQSVLQRSRELAVRSALGATPGSLASLVVGEGMRVTVIGVAAGALAAVGATRVLQSQFDGVGLTDARAGVLAAVVLCATMAAACYVPARRASRLDPADALRCD